MLRQSHAAYLIMRGIEMAAKGKDSFQSNKRTTIRSLFALPKDGDFPKLLINAPMPDELRDVLNKLGPNR